MVEGEAPRDSRPEAGATKFLAYFSPLTQERRDVEVFFLEVGDHSVAQGIHVGGRTGSGRYSGSGSSTNEETTYPLCISACRRRMSESLKPVAITVILTASLAFSSSTAPKMMLASSCAAP